MSENQRVFSDCSNTRIQQSSETEPDSHSIKGSNTEYFLEKYFAPYLISTTGRIVALLAFSALTVLSVYGCTKIRLYWSDELYIDESIPTYEFYQAKNKFF